MDGSYLWSGMVDFVMTILGFIIVVMIAGGVGFVVGMGLGYVVTLPFHEDKREMLMLSFAVIGGISGVPLAVYWIYF